MTELEASVCYVAQIASGELSVSEIADDDEAKQLSREHINSLATIAIENGCARRAVDELVSRFIALSKDVRERLLHAAANDSASEFQNALEIGCRINLTHEAIAAAQASFDVRVRNCGEAVEALLEDVRYGKLVGANVVTELAALSRDLGVSNERIYELERTFEERKTQAISRLQHAVRKDRLEMEEVTDALNIAESLALDSVVQDAKRVLAERRERIKKDLKTIDSIEKLQSYTEQAKSLGLYAEADAAQDKFAIRVEQACKTMVSSSLQGSEKDFKESIEEAKRVGIVSSEINAAMENFHSRRASACASLLAVQRRRSSIKDVEAVASLAKELGLGLESRQALSGVKMRREAFVRRLVDLLQGDGQCPPRDLLSVEEEAKLLGMQEQYTFMVTTLKGSQELIEREKKKLVVNGCPVEDTLDSFETAQQDHDHTVSSNEGDIIMKSKSSWLSIDDKDEADSSWALMDRTESILHSHDGWLMASSKEESCSSPARSESPNAEKENTGSVGNPTNSNSDGKILTLKMISAAASGSTVESIEDIDLALERIADANALSQCTSLKKLCLTSNSLVTLDCLKSLTGLQHLVVNDNFLKDIDAISHMKELSHLSLRCNSIRSTSSIRSLSGLKTLLISSNKLETITLNCKLLTRLDVSVNTIQSLQGLSACQELQYLDVSFNRLESLRGIESCTKLVTIIASENKIADFPDLSKQILLRELFLNVNRIERIKRRGWLPFLETLELADNKIAHVDRNCFDNFISLRVLKMSFNQISSLQSLDFLGHCKGLRSLRLNDNPVEQRIRQYKMYIFSLLPSLRELDNEIVPFELIQRAMIGRCSKSAQLSRVKLRGCQVDSASMWKFILAQIKKVCGARIDDSDFSNRYPSQQLQSQGWDAASLVELIKKQRKQLEKCKNGSDAISLVLQQHLEQLHNFSPSDLQNVVTKSNLIDEMEALRRRRKAAIQIQACFRAHLRKKRNRIQRRVRAAIRIQTVWRGAQIRGQHLIGELKRRRLELLNRAAVLIQSVWRAHAVRKIGYIELRRQERLQLNRSLVRKQNFFLEEAARERNMDEHRAATRIAAAVRGYLLRKKLKDALNAAREFEEDDDEFPELEESFFMPPEEFALELKSSDAGPDLYTPVYYQQQAINIDRRITATKAFKLSPPREHVVTEDTGRVLIGGEDLHRPLTPQDNIPRQPSRGGSPASMPGELSRITLSTEPSVDMTPSRSTERAMRRASRQQHKVESIQNDWGFKDKSVAEAFLKAKQRMGNHKQKVARKRNLQDPQKRLEKFRLTRETNPVIPGKVAKTAATQRPTVPLKRGEVANHYSRGNGGRGPATKYAWAQPPPEVP